VHGSFQLKAISFVHTGHIITAKIIENNAFMIEAYFAVVQRKCITK
jgi:hypothetical protein